MISKSISVRNLDCFLDHKPRTSVFFSRFHPVELLKEPVGLQSSELNVLSNNRICCRQPSVLENKINIQFRCVYAYKINDKCCNKNNLITWSNVAKKASSALRGGFRGLSRSNASLSSVCVFISRRRMSILKVQNAEKIRNALLPWFYSFHSKRLHLINRGLMSAL